MTHRQSSRRPVRLPSRRVACRNSRRTFRCLQFRNSDKTYAALPGNEVGPLRRATTCVAQASKKWEPILRRAEPRNEAHRILAVDVAYIGFGEAKAERCQ